MKIYFDMENFIHYIDNLYDEGDRQIYPVLDYILQNQEVHINHINPMEKTMCEYLPEESNDDETDNCFFNVTSNRNFCEKFYTELQCERYENIKHKFDIWSKMQLSGNGVKWNDGSDNEEPKDTLEYKFKDISTVSFLSDNEPDSKQSSDKNEISTLKSIFCIGDNYYPAKTYYTRDFQNWDTIKKNSTRCTELIIVDPFLFNTPIENFDNNVYKLINSICKEKVSEINVIIFANYDERIDILLNALHNSSLYQEIKKRVKADFTNITFVCPPRKRHTNSDGTYKYYSLLENLHDRYIITNHRLITSGHSFSQYFTSKNENELSFTARGSMWMNINSFADNNNEKVAIAAIKYLQNNIISLCDYRDIFGDFKSNLFTFNKNNVIDNNGHLNKIREKSCFKLLKNLIDNNRKYTYEKPNQSKRKVLFYVEGAENGTKIVVGKSKIRFHKDIKDGFLFDLVDYN